jgi:hypothetical protein
MLIDKEYILQTLRLQVIVVRGHQNELGINYYICRFFSEFKIWNTKESK